MTLNKNVIVIAAILLLMAAAGLWILPEKKRSVVSEPITSSGAPHPKVKKTGFVGSQNCKGCHETEYTEWLGSHHQQAMMEASEQSVLGDFNNTEYQHGDTTSRFYKKGARYFVETDGPEGKLKEYEIIYTFGVSPLQQYLIELSDGKYQALGIAWDSRSKAAGGQHWFHIYEEEYPDEVIDFKHPLHWTNPSQNWNYVCADCHSTQLKRNYDIQEKRYHTLWSEISVGCEACHGAGADHIAWAASPVKEKDASKGLNISFDERHGISWIMDTVTGSAKRSEPNLARKEIEVCGRCHARRTPFLDGELEGHHINRKLLDHYRLQLLTEGYYHPDGQPDNETYVLGSFMQSKMFQEGVTCSDCHNVHSLKPRLEGNGVCLQCHSAEQFDTPKHHFHKAGSAGGQCMDCHAPAQYYMVADKRHDHSFRIPRPDISISTGSPNACNNCHKDKSPEWAVEQINNWYGTHAKPGHQNYANTFFKVRQGMPDMGKALREIINNPLAPDIARATAIVELARYPEPESSALLETLATNKSDLIRMAVASSSRMLTANKATEVIMTLAADPVRAVRMEVARAAMALPEQQLTDAQRLTVNQLKQEYMGIQKTNADRAESLTNLGTLAMQNRDPVGAEPWLREAIRQNPFFAGSYISLASLLENTGRAAEAEQCLQAGIQKVSSNASLHHALGLLNIRQKQYPKALLSLRNAVTLAPSMSQYQYLYAMVTADLSSPDRGLEILQKALQKQPNNEQLLNGLMELYHQSGQLKEARETARKLSELAPDSQRYKNIRQQLGE